jgi:hypothetical protein
MVLGMSLAWKAMDHRDATGPFKKQNRLTKIMTFSQTFYTHIQNPEVQARLKETKLTFAGKQIPLYFNQESLVKFIKTDSKAKRALFIFSLFLFNIWFLPVIASFRQRKLKEGLFDLRPDLAVDNPQESRATPYYTTTFFNRTFYTSNLGSVVLLVSYFYRPVAFSLMLVFIGYAALSYHFKTSKYESLTNFQAAIEHGSLFRQVMAYFSPPRKKSAYDKIYHNALVKAQKRKVG